MPARRLPAFLETVNLLGHVYGRVGACIALYAIFSPN